MRKSVHHRLLRWLPAVALLLAASAACAQPCCECRCPGNEPRACSEEFGTDDAAYLEAVCEPLGCSIAVCTNRSCSQSNRCPDEETDFCDDDFDNDADGDFDCDDSDCEDAEGCDGGPTPTTPSGGTPGSSPTATPVVTPGTPSTVTPTSPPGSPVATPTDGETAEPTEAPTPTVTPETTDCCVGHETTPGCERRNCETCVCRADAFCCDAVWDFNCVIIAATECDALCRCEDLPTPTVTPTASPTGSPQVASDCCIGRPEEGGPGCEVNACERCVCEVDGFCCEDFWDPSCADIAIVDCPEDCACDAVPTPPTAGPSPTGGPPGTGTTVPAGSRTPTRVVFPTQTRRPCTTTDDCPSGQICNSAGRCIGVPSTPSNGGGGGGGSCTVQPSATEPGVFAWLIVPAALWVGRRRHARARGGSR